MSDTKEKKDNLITVYKAAQSLGIKAEVLQYQIDAGNIDSVEGMVYESVCDKISEQQATYIGIKAFLQNHNSDRFESKYVKNRNKYIDFLEDNAYFGIEIVEPDLTILLLRLLKITLSVTLDTILQNMLLVSRNLNQLRREIVDQLLWQICIFRSQAKIYAVSLQII